MLRWGLRSEQAQDAHSGPRRLLPAPKVAASQVLCRLATTGSVLTRWRPGPRALP